MTELAADYKALAAYRPKHKEYFVTGASLFDPGHDAAINIMRRIRQGMGAEVVHLGRNRSIDEVVTAALQEDVQGIAISSAHQGGHVHDRPSDALDRPAEGTRWRPRARLRWRRRRHRAARSAELHAYGVERIYSPKTASAWAWPE